MNIHNYVPQSRRDVNSEVHAQRPVRAGASLRRGRGGEARRLPLHRSHQRHTTEGAAEIAYAQGMSL